MHVINAEGDIVEGQPLTTEEVEILSELSSGGINNASGGYIASRDEKKIAYHLISKYRLTRREEPTEEATL